MTLVPSQIKFVFCAIVFRKRNEKQTRGEIRTRYELIGLRVKWIFHRFKPITLVNFLVEWVPKMRACVCVCVCVYVCACVNLHPIHMYNRENTKIILINNLFSVDFRNE